MLFSFNETPYIAIIGDIKKSRERSDRMQVQHNLQNTLDKLNQQYQATIASRFMITLGDEFQGLLKSGENVVYMIDQIERDMHPVKLRFGIGVGSMKTEIQPDWSPGSDGPAYYLAREMIEHVKKSESEKKQPMRTTEIKIQEHENICRLLNSIFSLLAVMKAKWTDMQIKTINAYYDKEPYNKNTQEAIAESLKKDQSTIQRTLSAANFYTYQDALLTVDTILSKIEESKNA